MPAFFYGNCHSPPCRSAPASSGAGIRFLPLFAFWGPRARSKGMKPPDDGGRISPRAALGRNDEWRLKGCGDRRWGLPRIYGPRYAKNSDTIRCRSFLAGAQGLEPWAYGFGDDADKSPSGEISFEDNISTFQKIIAAVFKKTDSKIKQIGNFRNKPTVFYAETVGSEIMSDPSDFCKNLGLFLPLGAQIARNHSKASTFEKNPPKVSTFWRISSSFIHFCVRRKLYSSYLTCVLLIL